MGPCESHYKGRVIYSEDCREGDRVKDINIERIYNQSGDAFLVLRNNGNVKQTIEDRSGKRYLKLRVNGTELSRWEYLKKLERPVVLPPAESVIINSTEPFPAANVRESYIVEINESKDEYECQPEQGEMSC